MPVLDKKNLLPALMGVKLELGCGDRKRLSDAVGIDAIDYDCVDIVGDVYEVLNQIQNESILAVHSHHFFEHVRDVRLLMDEIARILRPDGLLEIVVPHFSNPYYYSDYTHKHSFGLYSFSYFSHDSILKRKVPHYKPYVSFELLEVSLIFKSSPPFYGRHGLKRILQAIFNRGRYMKEFYEENCCYLFPCYEIKFSLRRKRDARPV
jgi:SAM-dependent methyltransferase